MSTYTDYSAVLAGQQAFSDSTVLTYAPIVEGRASLPLPLNNAYYVPPGEITPVKLKELRLMDTDNSEGTQRSSVFVITDESDTDYQVSMYGLNGRDSYNPTTDSPGTDYGNWQTKTMFDTFSKANEKDDKVVFTQIDSIGGNNVVSVDISNSTSSANLNVLLAENGVIEPSNREVRGTTPTGANLNQIRSAWNRADQNNLGMQKYQDLSLKDALVQEKEREELKNMASYLNDRYGKTDVALEDGNVMIGDVILAIPPVNIQVSQMRTSISTDVIGDDPHPNSSFVNRVVIKLNAVFSGALSINEDLKRILLQYRFCPVNMIRSKDIFEKVSGEASFLQKDYAGTDFIPVTMDEYVLWTVEGSPSSVGITMQFSLFNYKAFYTANSTEKVEYYKLDMESLFGEGEPQAYSNSSSNRRVNERLREREARKQESSNNVSERTLFLSDAVHPYNMWIQNALYREGEFWDDDRGSLVSLMKVAKIDAMVTGLEGTSLEQRMYGQELSADEIGDNTAKFSVFSDTLVSLIAESISVYYSNSWAWQESLGYSQPSAQYIGPGTCTVQFHAKTDDNAVVNKLLRTYNEQFKGGRKYDDRYIFESQLTAISNARILSMRDCNISNSPGNPGWFDVNLSFYRDIYALHKIDENPAGEFDPYWGLKRLLGLFGDPMLEDALARVSSLAASGNYSYNNDGGEPLERLRQGSVAPEEIRINLRAALNKVLSYVENRLWTNERGPNLVPDSIREALEPSDRAEGVWWSDVNGADMLGRMHLYGYNSIPDYQQNVVADMMEQFFEKTGPYHSGRFVWDIDQMMSMDTNDGQVIREIILNTFGLGTIVNDDETVEFYYGKTWFEINSYKPVASRDENIGDGENPYIYVSDYIKLQLTARGAGFYEQFTETWGLSTYTIANKDQVTLTFEGTAYEANFLYYAFVAGNKNAGHDAAVAKTTLYAVDDYGHWPEFIVALSGPDRDPKQAKITQAVGSTTTRSTWTFILTYQGRDSSNILDWLVRYTENPGAKEELDASIRKLTKERDGLEIPLITPFSAHRYYPGGKLFVNASPIDSGTVGSWFAHDRLENMHNELLVAQKAADEKIAPLQNTAAWQSVYMEEQNGGIYMDMLNDDVYNPLRVLETLAYPQLKKDASAYLGKANARLPVEKDGVPVIDTRIGVFNSGLFQRLQKDKDRNPGDAPQAIDPENVPFSSLSSMMFRYKFGEKAKQVIANSQENNLSISQAMDQGIFDRIVNSRFLVDSMTNRKYRQITKLHDSAANNRMVQLGGQGYMPSEIVPSQLSQGIVEAEPTGKDGRLPAPIINYATHDAVMESQKIAAINGDTSILTDNSSTIAQDTPPNITGLGGKTYYRSKVDEIFYFGLYIEREILSTSRKKDTPQIPNFSQELVKKYKANRSFDQLIENAILDHEDKVPMSFHKATSPVHVAGYFAVGNRTPMVEQIKNTAELHSEVVKIDNATRELVSTNYLNSLMATSGIENAFPTYKMYIIESDTSDIKYYSLDDYYDFRLVQDLMVVRDRDNPSHLLKARVVVDERYVTMHKGATQQERAVTGQVTGESELVKPGLNSVDSKVENLYYGSSEKTEDSMIGGYVPMRAGMRVCVKLGYHSDPRLLDTVFIGTITGLQDLGKGGAWLLEARGDGRELTVPATEENTENVSGETYSEIIRKILRENPSVVHFGKVYGSFLEKLSREHYALLALGRVGAHTAGLLGAGLATGAAGGVALSARSVRFNLNNSFLKYKVGKGFIGLGLGLVFGQFTGWGSDVSSAFSSVSRGIQESVHHYLASGDPLAIGSKWNETKKWMGGNIYDLSGASKQASRIIYESLQRNNDPIDDNIFAVDIWADFMGSDGFNMTINNKKAIWDCLVDIKRCYPNFALDVRPYGNRSTLFLGPKEFNYWRTDDPVIAMAPQLHQLSNEGVLLSKDYQGILEGFAARKNVGELDTKSPAAAHFMPFQKHHVVTSEGEIISNGIRCTPDRGWNKVIIGYGRTSEPDQDPESISMVANESIDSGEIRVRYKMLDWTSDPEVAKQYAVGLLKDGVERMYGGTLVIRGNSRVEPYDMVYVSDNVNKMYGWVQVDTVIQKFDRNMGYTTHIVPNLVCAVNSDVYSTQWDIFRKQVMSGDGISDYMISTGVGIGAGALVSGSITAGAATIVGAAIAYPAALLIGAAMVGYSIYEVGKDLAKIVETTSERGMLQAQRHSALAARKLFPELLDDIATSQAITTGFTTGMVVADSVWLLSKISGKVYGTPDFIRSLPERTAQMKKDFGKSITHHMTALNELRWAKFLDNEVATILGKRGVKISALTPDEFTLIYQEAHEEMRRKQRVSSNSEYDKRYGSKTVAEQNSAARTKHSKETAPKSPFDKFKGSKKTLAKLGGFAAIIGFTVVLDALPTMLNTYLINAMTDSNVMVIHPLWSHSNFMLTGLEGYKNQNGYMHLHDKIVNAKSVLGGTINMAKEWAPVLFSGDDNEYLNRIYRDQKYEHKIQKAEVLMPAPIKKDIDEQSGVEEGSEPVVDAYVSNVKRETKDVRNNETVLAKIEEMAIKYDFEEEFIKAIIHQESQWETGARSRRGAYGLMQMMPKTAKDEFEVTDIQIMNDPVVAVEYGVRYLDKCRTYSRNYGLDQNDKAILLSSYNAGPTITGKKGRPVYEYNETADYIDKVMGYYWKYKDGSI